MSPSLTHTETVVIGAGIVGVSIARLIAERGSEVTVVERKSVGAGASGRNAGTLVPPLDPSLHDLYEDTLVQLDELAERNDGVALATPVELMLVNRGADEETERLRDLLAEHAPEFQPEALDPAQTRTGEPTLADGVSACRCAGTYVLDPGTLTQSVMDVARRAGAKLLLDAEAEIVVDGGRAVGVRLADGTLTADRVIVCPGAWCAPLVARVGVDVPIKPRWGVIVPMRLPRAPQHLLIEASGFLDELVAKTADSTPAEPAAGNNSEAAVLGFGLVTIDGASTLGHTLSDERPDLLDTVDRLLAYGKAYVPSIAGAQIAPARRCARPATPDGLPLIGPMPGIEACYLISGHGGHGVSTGPGSARLLVDAIHGDRPLPAEFDPGRFASASQGKPSKPSATEEEP